MDAFPRCVVAFDARTLSSISSFTRSDTLTDVILAAQGPCAAPRVSAFAHPITTLRDTPPGFSARVSDPAILTAPRVAKKAQEPVIGSSPPSRQRQDQVHCPPVECEEAPSQTGLYRGQFIMLHGHKSACLSQLGSALSQGGFAAPQGSLQGQPVTLERRRTYEASKRPLVRRGTALSTSGETPPTQRGFLTHDHE